MPNDTPEKQQRNSFVKDLLSNFTFAVSQGLAAASTAPRGRGSTAALAGALQAPMVQDEMARQREAEDMARRLQESQLQGAELNRAIGLAEAFSSIPGMDVTPPPTRDLPIPGLDGEPGVSVQTPSPPRFMRNPRIPAEVQLPGELGAIPITTPEQRALRSQEFERLARERNLPFVQREAQAEAFGERFGELAAERSLGFVEQGDMTPEEIFTQLKIREAGPNLSVEREREVRAEARQEWMGLSRDPEIQALTEELREVQLEMARMNLTGDGMMSPRQMSYALQLSNSLKAHPAYIDMLDIATGMTGVEVGLSQGDGFGDIAAINAFQRMIDPGATVREGDVGLLQSASSLLDRIFSDYPLERLREGDQLPSAVRERMRTTAEQLYEVRANNYNDAIGRQYRALASGAGVDFGMIGQDFPTERGDLNSDLRLLGLGQ